MRGTQVVRDAQAADVAAIVRIGAENDLFSFDLDDAGFERMLVWSYRAAPAPAGFHAVAERASTIVGHYGLMPFAYRIDGAPALCGIAGNLVIVREQRRGWMFIAMQRHLTETFPPRGFDLIYAIGARPEVIDLNIRVGWTRSGLLPIYAKPYRVAALLSASIGSTLLRALALPFAAAGARVWRTLHAHRGDVTVTAVAEFPPEIAAFAEAFSQALPTLAVRSAAVLAWRFGAGSERDYRIAVARRAGIVVGSVVTRVMTMHGLRTLAVVDLAALPRDRGALDALFVYVDGVARRERVDVASALSTPAGAFVGALRRAGYLRAPESLTLLTQSAPQSGPLVDERFLRDWHLSWFDHDFV